MNGMISLFDSMPSTPEISTTARAGITGALSAALLWQVYVVVSAALRAPEFENLFQAMGVDVPIFTKALFATYRFWFAVPLTFFIVAIDLFRKPARPAIYVGIVVFAAIVAGFALQAWLYEGCLEPLFRIMHAVR